MTADSEDVAQKNRPRGDSDFKWLKEQALDKHTLGIIEMIEKDEREFFENGVITQGEEEFELHLRQGTFHTSRATGHSIAHIFVHIFKNKEHQQAPGFEVIDHPVIVDIGANEGYYAIAMAKKTGAKVVAIEPNPIAYKFLVKNIESNGLEDKIIPVNSAIWSSRGVSEFNILPQVTSIGTMSITSTSFMSGAADRVVKLPVRTITLADVIGSYSLSHVDLLKIDIEGGELEVLRSSVRALEAVDRVVLEYHSQEIKNGLVKLLGKNGYELQYHAPDRADFGDLYFRKVHAPQPFLWLSKLKYFYS